MKKMTALLSLLALAGLLAYAQTANVAGSWDITVTSPRGERTNTMTIVQDGEKITVTMTSQRGESTGEGTVKGNVIEWSVTRSTPRGEFTVVYKGTVEGGTMSGQAQMGDFGSMDWKAVKKAS
ncbi:MAG: hypothetical protein A2Y56_11005 [Candidatus Aminicenantes bacterium RBG_13_63_10]|nr:MAG: hypothetical protein A2Y56_11005 [Candidatus Aminicenantes bacterium RBG_13_63_10]